MSRAVLSCLFVLALVVAPAAAQQFFADPFSTDAGQYATGDLVYQNPLVGAFSSAWAGGLYGPSTAYDVVGTGLSWTDASYGQSGGSVVYTGSGSATTESLVRGFANPVTTADETYFMSGLMSFDANFASTPGASVFTGFLNAEEGDASVPWVIGAQFGFRANDSGGVDAVMRARGYSDELEEHVVLEHILATDLVPGEHLFVAKVISDYTGGSADLSRIWVDPADTGNELALGLPTFAGETTNFLDPDPAAPERTVDTLVLSATNIPNGSEVGFDEIRMGTTLDDVITIATEPSPKSPIAYRQGEFKYEHVAIEIRGGSSYENRNFQDTRGEMLVGCTPNAPFRSLLEFDLDYIPEGATVTGVELELTVKRTDGPADHAIELRLADPPQALVETEVTYLQAAAGVAFTVPGGDVTDTVLGTMDGLTTEDVNEMQMFESTAAFIAAAQAALDAGKPLELALVSPGIEAANVRNFYGFYSDDAILPYRPLLRVSFDDGSGPDLPGDLNGDGAVGSADLDIVRGNWGSTTTPGDLAAGDPSGDGSVGSADLDIVRANWGSTAAASIPEPCTWTLLLTVAGLFAIRRGRNAR